MIQTCVYAASWGPGGSGRSVRLWAEHASTNGSEASKEFTHEVYSNDISWLLIHLHIRAQLFVREMQAQFAIDLKESGDLLHAAGRAVPGRAVHSTNSLRVWLRNCVR